MVIQESADPQSRSNSGLMFSGVAPPNASWWNAVVVKIRVGPGIAGNRSHEIGGIQRRHPIRRLASQRAAGVFRHDFCHKAVIGDGLRVHRLCIRVEVAGRLIGTT